jgi:hypothetical protein
MNDITPADGLTEAELRASFFVHEAEHRRFCRGNFLATIYRMLAVDRKTMEEGAEAARHEFIKKVCKEPMD